MPIINPREPIDRKPKTDPTQAASAKLQEAVKKNDLAQVKVAMDNVADA